MTNFGASFPPGAGAANGEARPDGGLDAEEARRLVDGLEAAGPILRGRSNETIVAPIGAAARRLLDPDDPIRREAEERMPAEAAISPAMARLLIDRMAADWTTEVLERLLAAELHDPRMLEGFRPGPGGDRIMALGDRFAFHVGAGNVPGVGATSMIRSLLVRTPLLLKPGRGDTVLPVLIARALAEEDPELAEALAVVYWPGGSEPPLEVEALRRAERVVAYGGRESIEALRRRIPPETPLVAYGHRLSAAAIGRETLQTEERARDAARQAAEAVAAYDQRGCVSPQQIWVEEGGRASPPRFAALLAEALDAVGRELPPGPLDPAEAARIHQIRGAAEMGAAVGDGRVLHAPAGLEWTVLYEPGMGLEAGCTGRLVRVRPLEALERLPRILGKWSGLVQSIAIEADAGRRGEVARRLAEIGVSRVTRLERQAWPRPWWTHDGQGPLRVLLRWSTLEGD